MAACLVNLGKAKRAASLVTCVLVVVMLLVPSLDLRRAHGQTSDGSLAVASFRTTSSLTDLQALEQQVQATVDKALRATVSIQVGRGGIGGIAFGSGVIVSEDGYVLTAAHVSGRPNRRVTFRFGDGRTAAGITLGLNQDLDMGLMKITDSGPWPFLERGGSADIELGDWCLATGYPGGFEHGGVPVVRLGRILKSTSKVFLTDCTLVGGDSGGPLLDLSGNVIGIHSRIGADLTTNLHVPVDRFTASWDKLLAKEVWGLMRSVRPWIGVEHDSRAAGARIKRVRDESPAERAGLQAGDLIVRFAGERVSDFDELKRLVAQRQPGDEVTVQVRRGNVAIESLVKVGQLETLQNTQTRDDAELLRGWLDQIERRRYGGRAIVSIGKNSDQVKEAFHDALVDASRSTVQVLASGRVVAFGTVVGQGGFILTKASQLKGDLQCRYRGSKSFPVKKVSESRTYDLALLKADRKLPSIDMRTAVTPRPGSLLASSSLNVWPLAVGVTSGSPREIPSEGKLGIHMDGTTNLPVVSQIIADSGAEKAGILHGDVIASIDDQPVSTASQLIEIIDRRYLPGDVVQVRVRRGGTMLNLKVTLQRQSEFDEALAEFEDFIGGQLSERRTGFPLVVQHDAAILPRNCGGPVVDSRGRFVGINIARAARTSSYVLPAAEVESALRELLSAQAEETQTIDVVRTP